MNYQRGGEGRKKCERGEEERERRKSRWSFGATVDRNRLMMLINNNVEEKGFEATRERKRY